MFVASLAALLESCNNMCILYDTYWVEGKRLLLPLQVQRLHELRARWVPGWEFRFWAACCIQQSQSQASSFCLDLLLQLECGPTSALTPEVTQRSRPRHKWSEVSRLSLMQMQVRDIEE